MKRYQEWERNITNKATRPLSIQPHGVAITLLNDHPTWFQRRYTIMIQNALNNIPSNWVIQIFHPTNKQFYEGLAINGGIQKLMKLYPNRIIFTPLPTEVSERKRPIHIMLHPWLWENMLHDNVLVFVGNHVICSNSPYQLQDFLRYHYISAPWGLFKGIAGGSGLSIRNRKVMLKLIHDKLNRTDIDKRDKAYLEWGRDDEFFVGEMIQHNKIQGGEVYRLPPKEVDSLAFSYLMVALGRDSIFCKWRDFGVEFFSLSFFCF